MFFAPIGEYISFILLGEITCTNLRSIFSGIVNCGFNFCGLVYILLFKYTDSWRIVFITSSGATFITALIIFLYAKESPKFFIIKKDFIRYIQSLKNIAHKNQRLHLFNAFYIAQEEKIKEHFQKLTQTGRTESFNSEINTERQPSSLRLNSNKDINVNINAVGGNDINSKTERLLAIDENEKENNIQNAPNSPTSPVEEDYNRKSENLFDKLMNREYSALDLLRYPSQRKKFIILCFLYFMVSSNYYAITFNLKNLKGDIYTLGLIMYSVDTVAYIFGGFIANVIGRKTTILSSLFVGVCAFGLIALIKLDETVEIVFSFIARFSIAILYNLIFTYAVELYPTVVRSYGFGYNTLFEKLGSLFSPIITEYFVEYLNLVFALVNIFNFIIVSMLPETLNKPLEDFIPELIEQEETNRDQGTRRSVSNPLPPIKNNLKKIAEE